MAFKLSDLLNPITGIVRGTLNRRSTGSAVDKITGGIDAATAAQKQGLDRQYGLYDPYRQAGQQGLTKLTDLALNPAQFTGQFQGAPVNPSALFDKNFAAPTQEQVAATPGYQFALGEGQKAIERSAAARHGLVGGATLKSLDRYSTDYANTNYNDAFDRSMAEYGLEKDLFQGNEALKYGQSEDAYNRGRSEFDLGRDIFDSNADRAYSGARDLTGIGQSATAGLSGAEASYADQVSELEQAKADALAMGDLAKAQELDEMISGLGDTATDLLGNTTVQSGISKLGDLLGIGGGGNNPSVSTGIPSTGQSALKQGITSAGIPSSVQGVGTAAAGLAPDIAKAVGPLGAGLGSISSGVIPGVTGTAAQGAVGSSIMAAGNAAAPTAALAGPGAGTAGGGLGSAAVGFLTNPWTIGIGAGLLGATAWLKSQAHHEANTIVKKIENPFWDSWGQILPTDKPEELAALPPDQAQDIKGKLLEMNTNYQNLVTEFRKGGSDEKKVSDQSLGNTQKPMQEMLAALDRAIGVANKPIVNTSMPAQKPTKLSQLFGGG